MSGVRESVAGRYRSMAQARECQYCGQVATTIDHWVPRSVAYALKDVGTLTNMIRVPACSECNGLARAVLFRTMGAKRRFIQAKLRRRYARLLTMPAWSESDKSEMEYAMREMIEAAEIQKSVIERRLRYRPDSRDLDIWKSLRLRRA